jgi:hypothetical protein
MKVSQLGWFLAAVLAASIAAADASAASIGVNFRRANGATLMTTPESAGFVPQTFWNNSIPAAADPQAGTTANILVDDGAGTTDTGTIYDDAGNPTAVGIDWFANTSWSANNAGNADSKLLTGYIDNTNAALPTQIQFTNIPYSHYDVIAYVGSDGNNRLGHVGIVGHGQGSYYRTISQSSPAGGLAPAYVTNPAPLTNFNAPGANANYVRFTGLSGSSFRLINARISANVGVHGVQILEMPGAAPPPPQPAPLELLGYWSFNDSTANDSSGNGNHAVLSGDAAFGPGQFGNSLVLDGTRDFASVAAPSAIVKPTDTLAVSVWVKNQEGVSEGEVLSLGDHYGLRLRNDGRLHFFYDIRPDNADAWLGLETTSLASERVVNDGQWHHIVAQKTPSALEIYVDGVKAVSPAANPTTLMPIDYVRLQQGLFFGAHGNGSTAIDFQGMLDEIRIFRGTLTPEQINNLYQSNVVPEPTTWTLAAVGCLAVGLLRRRKK